MSKVILKIFFLLLLTIAFSASSAMASTILINNIDDPGKGLNDPTKVKPVGKNKGTTLGAQRLNVFNKAAEIWGSTLQSNIPIWVQATFQDRGFTPCTANSAVLGAAGTIQIFANTPNALWTNTWYHSALANKLANADQQPGSPDPGFLVPPFADDIIAFFNPNLGAPNCLAGSTWYYGLDNQAPAGTIDFLNVVLHEFAHGLGFASFANDNGTQILGLPDIYGVYSRDNTADKQWNQMNNSERLASSTNTGNLVWNGPSVTNEAPNVLSNRIDLKITSGSLNGTILEPFGTGGNATPTPANFGGEVVYVNDGVVGAPVPPSTVPGTVNDGCEPFGGVAGKIAMVDRGFCSFTIKTTNAQNAGATGLLVVNNAGGDAVVGMSIAGPTIPAVMISTVDGNLVKANLPLSVGLIEDPTQLAGADPAGHVRLFAPSPFAPGSSVSHWDNVALPNLLMEPAITSTLKGATTLDLTDNEMFDIGWSGNLSCPVNSDNSLVVQIGTCNTGVTNDFGPFTLIPSGGSGQVFGGCTVSDIVNSCGNKSCLAQATSSLRAAGVITEAEKDAILNCSGSL
jgi:hypothetical protein